MTDERDLRIPDFFDRNFCLPQFNYMADSAGFCGYYIPDFNPYTVNTYSTGFTPFYNFFDFSLKNIPTLDIGTSVFGLPPIMPVFNNLFFEPLQIIPPVKTSKTKADKQISEVTPSYEPENTDADKVVQTPPATPAAKPKTQRAFAGLDSKTYVAEEILPGHFVHKGKYLNTKDLKPYMKEKLVELDKKATELGYTLVVSDGFRSHQAQIDLKRRKPGLAATPGKSAHEYGVAIDIGLYKNGRLVDIYKEVPEFGAYAESLGLEWGARWRTKYEPWHFNMKNWTELADVRDEYRHWNHLA